MIINIDPLERIFEIITNQYYPVHSHLIIDCFKDTDKLYTILCMNEQIMTVEEYLQLRRQTVNIELNEYLKSLLETGLKYIIYAAPILLFDYIAAKEEKNKPNPNEANYIFKRNVLIKIEQLMQQGIITPHSTKISEDQSVVPELLRYIFPQENGVYIGRLLYENTNVYIPIDAIPTHIGIIGTTGAGKSNLMQVMQHGIIDHNINVISNCLRGTPMISSLAIDPHDEYALGPEGKGLYHLMNLLAPALRNEIFGGFFYLTPRGSHIQAQLSSVSLEAVINYEEILPIDLLNVQEFTGVQSEVMLAEEFVAHEDWLNNILSGSLISQGHHDSSIAAVRRRLRAVQRSRIFIPADEGQSTLPDIIDALECGRILDFNCSLISDFEMFLFNTVVARTIFEIRKALKASNTMNDFQNQLRERLPAPFVDSYSNRLDKYLKEDDLVKDPKDMPIILFTIEEAPSILNPKLMKDQNVFKDIARQGRKFHIALAVISQQISTLDNAIISNINTYIDLPVGSDKERRGLIDNSTTTITMPDLRSLEGTLGVSIINGKWLTKFEKILIPRYIDHFASKEKSYQTLSSSGTSTSIF
ncbi:MAG: ATP-binding protein [Promethearchaeia archaeon]